MENPPTNVREENSAGPDPNERLVQVFDSKEESEAMVVRGLLEANGIEAVITGLDAPQDTFPGVGGSVVRVREEDAEAARGIIEAYRVDGDAEAGEAATESSDDSAA